MHNRKRPLLYPNDDDPDLCSEDTVFEFRPGHRLSCIKFFYAFRQSLQANARGIPRLYHEHFLSDPFKIIVRLTSFNWKLHNLATESLVK
jgi:hypothetical protein